MVIRQSLNMNLNVRRRKIKKEMRSEMAPEDRTSNTEDTPKRELKIRDVGRDSKGNICPKLKICDSIGQELSLNISESEGEHTDGRESRETQKDFIKPRRKRKTTTRRSTAGTAPDAGSKGTGSKEKRREKEPPKKPKGSSKGKGTGNNEMAANPAEITRNMIAEGANWLPLNEKIPADEDYPE
ncbi:hypothetical protein FQA39_LY17769 [Lamprigera yunnana]|nr:hypothetical protein FQA39_LY17769 [Lamprigera yunnana]